jgi:hemolysin D
MSAAPLSSWFRARRPAAGARSRADAEFLPAALEILETPASPVKTALIWFICMLATGALVWTYFGQFDIVATAQGKIQPAGRVKIIQSIETGKTVAVPVANGARVHAGDVLVSLDDTDIRAERTALAASLAAYRGEVLRRQAVVAVAGQWRLPDLRGGGVALPSEPIQFPGDIPEAITEREQRLYKADLAELLSSLSSLAAQRRERQAQIERLARMIKVQEALVATLSERVGMRSALVEAQAASRANMIDALEARQKEDASLAERKGQHAEAQAALDVIAAEAVKLIDTFLADNIERQSEASRRVDELEQQFIKANRRHRLMTIRSPIDGTVQASAITTIGQVVAAGSEIMRVVPGDGALEIEAYLPNRDVGFVAAGQRAVIKVEAFPFTRYGVIEGHVTRVGTDAIPEPDAQQLEAAAAQDLQSIVPAGNAQRMQNLVFPITIEPTATALTVDGHAMPLSSGMAVTVEVKTGKRRILEYLFSPLAEVTAGAMKER